MVACTLRLFRFQRSVRFPTGKRSKISVTNYNQVDVIAGVNKNQFFYFYFAHRSLVLKQQILFQRHGALVKMENASFPVDDSSVYPNVYRLLYGWHIL